jgi:hypothetical protein
MIRFGCYAAFSVFILTSCKKDDAKSKTDLLTSGNWKFSANFSKTNNGAWIDYTSAYLPCESDNYVAFRTNGSYESNEGASKCNASDPQVIESGSWKFINNESKIVTGVDTASIDELSGSTLTIISTDVFNGTTYYDKVIFKH